MTTRDDHRREGAALRARLGQGDDDPSLAAPGYRNLVDEMVYHGIWAREGLSLVDRMIPALAVLALSHREVALSRMVGAALDLGVTPQGILEIFIQTGLYGGFSGAEAAMSRAGAVFAERDLSLPDEEPDDAPLQNLDAIGRDLMATLHGDRSDAGYAAPDNPVTSALYAGAIRYGYGNIWQRPGLELRQRVICAIASFVTLGLDGQLKKCCASAKNAGLSDEEVIETVMQTAPYAGYPKALNALIILKEVP